MTGGARPGDGDFTAVTGRRPVVEAVMAAAARATPGVTVRRGVAVGGLVAGAQAVRGVPHVTGVRTAAERRSPPTLSSTPPAGVPRCPTGSSRPGRAVRSRSSRTRGSCTTAGTSAPPTAPPRPSWGPLLQAYGSVSILTLPADNGTWGIGVIASAADKAMRGLRDIDRWNAVVRSLPLAAHWLDGEPIEDRIVVMAKIEDRHRNFTVDGAPVATGVVAVADSWACTNPSLGRGASIGMMHCLALRDTLRSAGVDDPAAFSTAWAQATDVDRRALVPRHACRSTVIAWPRSTPRSAARPYRPDGRRLGHRPGHLLRGRPGPRLPPGRAWPSRRPRDPRGGLRRRRRLFEKALTLGAGLARRADARAEPERAPVHRGSLTPPEPPRARRERETDMRVDVSGVGIEYEVTGEGPPVVLLHGFPDSGRLWRNQVPALVEAGFSTIVPDLRGYGASDQPAEVEAYSIPYLAGDVVAILDALGVERAHVVGHDWGAALAWAFGSLAARPGRPLGGAVGRPPRVVRLGGLRPAREVVVHAAVPVRGRGRAVVVERRLGQPAGVGRLTPTSTASSPISRRRSRSHRPSTTTAPTCRPSRSSARRSSSRPCRPTPWACGAAATSP